MTILLRLAKSLKQEQNKKSIKQVEKEQLKRLKDKKTKLMLEE